MCPQLPTLLFNQIVNDVLQEEKTEWWGEHADSTLRRGLLYEDLKRGQNVDENGNINPQQWFIGNKQTGLGNKIIPLKGKSYHTYNGCKKATFRQQVLFGMYMF